MKKNTNSSRRTRSLGFSLGRSGQCLARVSLLGPAQLTARKLKALTSEHLSAILRSIYVYLYIPLYHWSKFKSVGRAHDYQRALDPSVVTKKKS